MTSVLNLGSIKHLTIPSEWSCLPLERGRAPGEISQVYTLKADPEVELFLYYRGSEEPKLIAEDFLKVLAAPPHKLSEEERFATECVIRNLSEESFFKQFSIATESINGTTVLVVDGQWKESQMRNLGVFVNGDGKGAVIDELHYTAPPEKFDAHLPAVRAILSSIRFGQGERAKS
ncbi:MAG: hypothetical protein JST01_23070 [Cyanobacteria bacterium SZAS TMP-1]|nr:hypothetical protein [Cyanobacteria bacterium SZAS TMP-1]